MFHEPQQQQAHSQETGWIEVICGSMFSGKTEELLRRLRRAEIAGLRLAVFKPAIDTRYHTQQVVSHDQARLQAHTVADSQELLALAAEAQLVAVDEAQFLDPGIVEVANTLANQGKRVILAGLDMDFRGRPFGPMPQLLAVAEYVTKLHAICQKSGQLANYTFRLGSGQDQVALGAGESYEARSRKHFWAELND